MIRMGSGYKETIRRTPVLGFYAFSHLELQRRLDAKGLEHLLIPWI